MHNLLEKNSNNNCKERAKFLNLSILVPILPAVPQRAPVILPTPGAATSDALKVNFHISQLPRVVQEIMKYVSHFSVFTMLRLNPWAMCKQMVSLLSLKNASFVRYSLMLFLLLNYKCIVFLWVCRIRQYHRKNSNNDFKLLWACNTKHKAQWYLDSPW